MPPSGRVGPTCFRGLGREAAEVARYEVRETGEHCGRTGSGERECLFGAARTIANASGAPGIAPAQALCSAARRETRAACFSGVGLVLGMLYATDGARQAACKRVAGKDARACLEAARAEIDPTGIRAWG